MRSSLGLLVVMLLAAAIGVVAAHHNRRRRGQVRPAHVGLNPDAAQRYRLHRRRGTNGVVQMYLPAELTVRVGQKVTWINRDSSGHTATADNGAFNTDVLNPGQKYTWTPKHPGTYSYSDYTQSNLQGTIVVGHEKGRS